MLPKEHGAYGQFAFPVMTALAAAGVSTPGLSLTMTAAVCFVAHEPAVIMLGLRGARARREHGRRAVRWLGWCALAAVIGGAVSLLTMPIEARWSLAVALVPAALLAMVTVRGREKSWYGEVLAAVTFSALAVPIAMSAGAPVGIGAAVALPFALLFVTSTLAVRSVILRVRRGGHAKATSVACRSALGIMAVGAVSIAWLTALDLLPASTLVAIAPGLLVVLMIVMRPPPPARLRALGWTLVAASVLTAVVVVAGG